LARLNLSSRALGLERGDLARALPLTLAYGFTLAAIYVLKPTRNALFLQEVGVDRLPWVLLMVAVAGAAFVAAYERFAGLTRTDRLVQWTLAGVAVSLVGFRALLELRQAWVYFAFFVAVQLFGLLTTSLVWLWANAACDPRQARRVFGLIGTGGIVGAIGGGLFTGAVASRVGAPNLLFVAAALLGAIALALRFAPPTPQRPRDAAPARAGSTPEAEAAGGNALPRLLALNAGLIAFVAVFVDIQFNDVVDRHFGSAESKAQFFGAFFAGVSGFSLVFQVVVTPWLLRKYGVGPALSVLPGALGLGSVVFMATSAFPLATLPKAADGSFRHSVHKAASELLFLPIPERVKRRTKLFIDTAVDTTATGLGALAVLALTQGLGLSYVHLTGFTVALVLGSLALVRRVRQAYVDAFRRAIERRHIDLDALTVGLDEAGAVELLIPALASDNPREVAYGLDLVGTARAGPIREAVAGCLSHPRPEIRRRALQVLGPVREVLDADGRPRLIDDPDPDVRATALTGWLEIEPDAAAAELEAALDADAPERAGPALVALRSLPMAQRRALLTEARLERLDAQRAQHPELAAALAGALAAAVEPRLYARLQGLLEHAPAPVLQSAVEGFAVSGDPTYVPWLLDRLEDRRVRGAARRALVAFGTRVVDDLTEVVDDLDRPIGARRAALRALSDLASGPAVAALLDRLQHAEPLLAREVVEGLARIRRRSPGTRFPRGVVVDAIRERLGEWRLILACRRWLPEPIDDASALFDRAMREKADRLREEVFALLGLIYDPAAMADSGERSLADDDLRRSSAIEYVQNTVDPALGRMLVPLLETTEPERALAQTQSDLGELPRDPAQLLLAWSRGRDPWLSACALYAQPSVAPELDPATWSSDHAPHPLVGEVLDANASGEAG
jgi:AAA family ATP:ADP antiporter